MCEWGFPPGAAQPQIVNVVLPRLIPIDAAKIKTLADVVLIIEVFQFHVQAGSPAHERLKHLLKEQ